MTEAAPPPAPASPPAAPPPQYAAPPQSAPPPAPIERPGMVTGAAIVLIILGVLTLLIGAFVLLVGGLFAGAAGSGIDEQTLPGFGSMAGAFAGVVIVLAAIIIIWGLLELLSGINILSGRGWARIVGIILAVLGVLFSLAGLGGSGAQDSSPVISIILIVAYAFVVWALATSGRWFASRA